MTEPVLSQETARFETTHLPLSSRFPELGTAAVLPWDSEIFGFRVGELAPGNPRAIAGREEDLARETAAWAEREDVHLAACRVPAAPATLPALVETAGFRFVEIQLRATLPRLAASQLRATRLTVRPAEPSDGPPLVRIAGSAFMFGRYHADPRFPRELADRRYRVWIERALTKSPTGWVAVVGPPGEPGGFLQVEIAAGGVADIRLAAVDPGAAPIAGPELFLGALHELARRGVSGVTARFSAVNTGVANIYAALGFRFHEPELVFHWHRPGSSRLVSLSDSLGNRNATDGSAVGDGPARQQGA